MSRSLYEDMADDTGASTRENEFRAFEHSIALLKQAQIHGPASRQSVAAIVFLSRLWGLLLEDLSHAENGLPDKLKGSLISIGIWMLRQAEETRQGRVQDFTGMIEVSQAICSGLRRI